jgi:hypothetical protein
MVGILAGSRWLVVMIEAWQWRRANRAYVLDLLSLTALEEM